MEENSNFGFINEQDNLQNPVENQPNQYNAPANQELNHKQEFPETVQNTQELSVDPQAVQPEIQTTVQPEMQKTVLQINPQNPNIQTNQQVNQSGSLSQETLKQFEQFYNYRKQQEKIQENGSAKKQRKSSGGLIFSFIAIGLACIIVGGIVGVLVSPNSANSIMKNIMQIEENQGIVLTPEKTARPANPPVIGGESYNIAPGEETIADICELMVKSVVGVKGYIAQSQSGTSSSDISSSDIPSSYGSGLIISKDGYILSNSHVIEGCDSFEVVLYDDTVLSAVLVGNDVVSDISVLKVEKTDLYAAPLGDSDAMRVGQQVIAIGNPLGEELSNSVTVGYVSGLRKMVFNGENQNMIQTDAAINSGNSGGPLVNLRGEVIGINTLKKIYSGIDDYGMPINTEGLGFAIPISVAKSMAEGIISGNPIERPGIGVKVTDVTAQDMAELNAPQGVFVKEVSEGGPASAGGILADDIITKINGNDIKNYLELKDELKKCNIGDKIPITIWRQGQLLEKFVVVGDLSKMY